MNIFLRIIISLIIAVMTMINNVYVPPKKTAKELIEKMVISYGYYEDAANDRASALLNELCETYPDEGERWTKIMSMWRAGLCQPLNYGVLPDGLPDTDELCIVILGFELLDDGQMRKELIGRLQTALASAEKYKNAYLLCSGGGTASNDRTVTEAGQMAKWLISNGIDEKRVIIEDKSETTAQNAMYVCDLLQSKYPKVKKLALITSDYHIEPSLLFFDALSVLNGSAGTDKELKVISNAAWEAPPHTMTVLFRAAGLIELTGDEETAKKVYNRTYDFESLLPLR